MNLETIKKAYYCPPQYALTNITVKLINLKTRITIHWLMADRVRPLADCGLGFLLIG